MEGAGRILACGGHDFDRRTGNEAITDLIVELAGGAGSRICLLPTASGDPEDQITRFRRAISERECEPSVISLFRLGEKPVSLRDELLAQDAVFVGGGSMVNLVAVWRAHGLDELLAECWRSGVLLSGQSAGAMCWFEQGITSSSGSPEAAPGFGLLPGSLSVHYRLQPARRRSYLQAVAEGRLPGGLGLEDQTAVLFRGRELEEALTARQGALAWRVARDGDDAVEEPLPCRRLKSTRPAMDDPKAEIIELRQTLAARAAARRGRRGGVGRWD
jgi:dipeptidase E